MKTFLKRKSILDKYQQPFFETKKIGEKTTNSTREQRGERETFATFFHLDKAAAEGTRILQTPQLTPLYNLSPSSRGGGGNIGEKKAFPLLLPLEEKVERGDDGERVKRWRRLCKGCAGPRLLGFARRFAYRFSGAVSYGGNRRTISLNFAGGAGYDISLVATFKHACFTRAIFLCIYTCVCMYLWLGLYRVSIVGNCNWIPPFFRKMVN